MPKVILSIANIYRLTTKSFLVILFSLCVSASFAGLFASSAHAETLDYNVNVEPALNVTIPTDTISLLLDPTNKTFSSQELNISVGTNNPYGYRLTMSSTGTSLIHTEDSSYTIPTLPTLDGGYTDSSFITNKWGYKQDSSAWNSYTSGVTLLESNAPVNNDNTNLSFGAKIDYDQAPGNYTLVLNFNAVAKVATNDLVITFAGEGVNSVNVCKVAGDCTGDNLVGTVSTSGNSVPGLEDGSTYYLYPVFTSGYEFLSWEKTSTAGTISDATVLNPTFTMTDEPAAVTVTGKATEYTITLDKTNATAIVIDDTSYSGSSATLTYGTHTISGTYDSGYEFDSWSTSDSTNLAIASTSSASTTITVHGAATLTLNGKSSCQRTVSGYMQDFNPCSNIRATSGSLTDRRDNQTYTVAKINGNWWMTQNLRFSGNTINSTNTNINTTKTISWSDLAYGDSYDAARYHNSGNTTNGYWYNYAGASAMTITGSDNSTNATYDICPKNWRLPTYSEFSGITSQATAFSHVTGGYFWGGTIHDAERGYWWSATAITTTSRYFLFWNNGLGTSGTFRYTGFYVRCVRSS